MAPIRVRPRWPNRRIRLVLVVAALAVSSCGTGGSGAGVAGPTTRVDPRPGTKHAPASTATTGPPTAGRGAGAIGTPLPVPAGLTRFTPSVDPGEGSWQPAGRTVDGVPAVYETSLTPPGGTLPAGIAWMDTHLLDARLYSGSESPGGGPYRYTAPVEPAQAASLVAAFNGGFKMDDAGGGYFTEGHIVVPLVAGAASLVIYADRTTTVGAWGTDVSMTPDVVAVRQNLTPLVDGGRPTTLASGADWRYWGNTCGAATCAPSVPGIEQQWRSGVGVTADGALVYVTGPSLTPLQLAQLLVRARVVRGMELDVNPYWTFLATYRPADPGGPASPANGTRLVATSIQGPATPFEPAWARDFVTVSARTGTAG